MSFFSTFTFDGQGQNETTSPYYVKSYLNEHHFTGQTLLERVASSPLLLVDVYTGLTLVHLCFQQARLQIICPRQHLLLCT